MAGLTLNAVPAALAVAADGDAILVADDLEVAAARSALEAATDVGVPALLLLPGVAALCADVAVAVAVGGTVCPICDTVLHSEPRADFSE